MSLPRIMTVGQVIYKYPEAFKEIIHPAFRKAYLIPGMLEAEPDPEAIEKYNGMLEACVSYVKTHYQNCIFAIPIDEEAIDFIFEASASAMITAMSIDQKYRNLCATLAVIKDDMKVGADDKNVDEWYLHNYKVAYTGDVTNIGSTSSSTATNITTTHDRKIGENNMGTSGETTATLRNVSRTMPYKEGENDVDTDTVSGEAEDNTTSGESSLTTSYDTLKEGYYNTGNKTTILKDVQDLAVNMPFFPKWLDEVMESIVIPVYTSKFGSRTGIF